MEGGEMGEDTPEKVECHVEGGEDAKINLLAKAECGEVGKVECGGGGEFSAARGVLAVLTLEHRKGPGGRQNLVLLQQTDLQDYIGEHKVDEQLCKKDKLSCVQRKISCWACTVVIESVQALRAHLLGAKHQEGLARPLQDPADFLLHNGKWKRRKGEKRGLAEGPDRERLSKRERTKANKQARSIPILAQHTEAKYAETSHYMEGGLRRVRPYHFTFTTHAKGRWVGDRLFDVFAREFRALPAAEYGRCIQAGLIRINDKPTTTDCRVGSNDVISHTVHRHELPVSGGRLRIIHQDQDWVVVDKPASVPVHPCGRYRHNTVLFILAKEHGLPGLHTVHRLDRLTSGVLLFARSAAKAREMEAAISGREVSKEYVARVVGEFPEGEVVCREPIMVVSYKIGVCVVDLAGKECQTVFQRLDYRDGVSVVRCLPRTGRMHQIRVHLQFLGHPIANDPLYNSTGFGPEKGKGGRLGKSHEQLILDLSESHTLASWIRSEEYKDTSEAGEEGEGKEVEGKEEKMEDDHMEEGSNNGNEIDDHDGIGEENEKESVEEESSGLSEETTESGRDPSCTECLTPSIADPPPATLVMWLHALRYSGQGWTYSTDLPAWARL